MNCVILDTLYVRANGDIPCHDDYGEQIILGRVQSEPGWSIADVLANPLYQYIRESLTEGRQPWRDICHGCAAFRRHEPLSDGLYHRNILTLQVEPSLGCSLACPCCSQATQIRQRPKPYRMAPQLFASLMASLREDQYRVREIEYCGQGEPLTHPQFRDFVALARQHYPNARQRLITSGNFDYEKTLGGTAIDLIYVSCDGLYQSSYEKYRVNGDVGRVLRFMKDIPKEVDGRSQLVVWKYILLEFNDSDREIKDAQEKAMELGVDQLQFVFTHSEYKSTRYTAANARELPVHCSNVMTVVTPVHKQNDTALRPLTSRGWPVTNVDGIHFMIDEVELKGDMVRARGWLLSRDAEARIRLSHNGRLVCEVAPTGIRLDVLDAYPEFYSRNSGFSAEWAYDGEALDQHQIDAVIVGRDQKVHARFSRKYASDEVLERRRSNADGRPIQEPTRLSALRDLIKLQF